jgi:hypothetical protein
MSNSQITMRLYGNVAVATGMYQEKKSAKGKEVIHSGRFTDIWVRQNGEWRCVGSQGTLISH